MEEEEDESRVESFISAVEGGLAGMELEAVAALVFGCCSKSMMLEIDCAAVTLLELLLGFG